MSPLPKIIPAKKGKILAITEKETVIPDEDVFGATDLYIGDNINVLTTLQPKYENKVDVIYIDPPYNTGKSFYSYKDKRQKTGFEHSSWLSMMKPRLELAVTFLNETGVLMVAIGMKEQPYLRILLDEIMGEENFISMLTMEGMLKNNASFVSTSNEYWLIYGKNVALMKEQNIKWRAPKKAAIHILEKAKHIWETSSSKEVAENKLKKYYATKEAEKFFEKEPGLKMYNRFDLNGKLYRSGDLSSPSNKGGKYVVINPNTNKKVSPPVRGWVHNEATFTKMIEDDLIEWNGNKTPYFKRYLENSLNVVKNDICSPNRLAPAKLLLRMIGRNKFTFPKDHQLIAEWVEYVLPDFRKRDIENPPIVMDFFAGSGSTAHAVAELNKKHQLHMKCILVTNNENSIPKNVTIPRLKAMVTGNWAEGPNEPLPSVLRIFSTKISSPEKEPVEEPADSFS